MANILPLEFTHIRVIPFMEGDYSVRLYIFGHHDCTESLYSSLYNAIERLMICNQVNEFYIGHHGAFDFLARKALAELSHIYPQIRWTIVLSHIPLRDSFPRLPTLVPDGIELIPPRYLISHRNRWLVEHCDYVIAHVEHDFGSAAQFRKMALRRGLTVIDI